MTDRDFDKFSLNFDKWKKDLINFGVQKDLLNKHLENIITNFLNFESQIYKSLIEARIFYEEKRQFYNQKIRKLKNKFIEYVNFLDYFIKESKNLPEPKRPKEIITLIERIIVSIRNIEQRITILNKKLFEEALNIDQENIILEELKNFEIQKEDKVDDARQLEKELENEIKEDIYFKTQRSIEILEINLIQIKENLEKWTKKRVECHKKMLNLYRKATIFENIQKQIDHELLMNKENANKYHHLFFEQVTQNKNKILDELFIFLKSTKKPKKVKPIKKPIVVDKELIKRKKSRKKFMKKKLTIALEKKKAGKKLDFYELKLILDHSKK